MSNYEREVEVALAAARAAGAIVLRYYESDTGFWEKSKDNPLTLADLESDRVIGEHLRAAFPKDAILSEETVDDPSRLANDRVWIVDPGRRHQGVHQAHPRVRRVDRARRCAASRSSA